MSPLFALSFRISPLAVPEQSNFTPRSVERWGVEVAEVKTKNLVKQEFEETRGSRGGETSAN